MEQAKILEENCSIIQRRINGTWKSWASDKVLRGILIDELREIRQGATAMRAAPRSRGHGRDPARGSGGGGGRRHFTVTRAGI